MSIKSKTVSERNKQIAEENSIAATKNSQNQRMAQAQLQIIEPQLQRVTTLYQETRNALDEYYNQGVIFEKYRGFVPICMFHEYLESGRCSKLEGHEGAYNIYESEIRMNLILSKLDEIIERLDRIEQNQYVIANAIRQTNNQLSQMYSSINTGLQHLDQIRTVASINTYYSGITAANTTYLTWLAARKGAF